MKQVLEPVLYFLAVWFIVILLYSLRLSYLLNGDIIVAWQFLIATFGCFLLGYSIALFLRGKLILKNEFEYHDENRLRRRIVYLFLFWICFTVLEVIVSGGIPIIWMILGNGKKYDEFGVRSVHGLLNALQLAISLLSFYQYKKYGKRRFLYITLFLILWNLCVITRQVIVVMMVELFFVYLYLEINKIKFLRNLFFYGLLFVVLFGIVGDLRSGSEHFKYLAQPSNDWPDWAPSGFLWVYIYISTPLNNLLYNFTFETVNINLSFPNTVSILFPSFIRNIFFDFSTYEVSGNLVTQAFNVSTAYASPYTDAGYLGVGLFSIYSGLFTGVFWWVKSLKRIFYRAIIVQMIVLSIFFNHYFYLPVAFQLVWIFIILLRITKDGKLHF